MIQRTTYDGFDRIAQHDQQNTTGALVSTKYAYDPLDRTASKTTDPGGPNEKTTNFSYLGLTDHVLTEDVAGQLTKTYRYTPTGERLSQAKINTDGSKEDTYYGYNDHADVENITDTNGDSKATYGYTAYGQTDDAETTGIDKPDPADLTKEPYNPYRYEGKRFDPNSGTYDMGFRDYSPGLNQFLARDTYNGALDDQNLATDPFTANRYAFSGGNPVGNIENDGHGVCNNGGTGDSGCGSRNTDGSLTEINPDPANFHTRSECDRLCDQIQAVHGTVHDGRVNVGALSLSANTPNLDKILAKYQDLAPQFDPYKTPFGQLATLNAACNTGPRYKLCGKQLSLSVLKDFESHVGETLGGLPGGGRLAEEPAPDVGSRLCLNSFPTGTRVLLANGKTKAIEKVKVGDKVRTTDPRTGKTVVKKVTAAFGGTNYDYLVQITIDIDGKYGHHTGTIIATEHHKFWNQTSHSWTRADHLTAGVRLRTPEGKTVRILRTAGVSGHLRVRDLTIDGYHTFYVQAGNVSILVHNSGDGPASSQVPDLAGLTQSQADEVLTRYGFELQAISQSGSYATYQASDGSKITVRLTDGRITRTSTIDMGPNTRNRTQRWDQFGNPTDSHNTGEHLGCE